jgi:hypothetical protein
MKTILVLLVLCATAWSDSRTAAGSTNSTPANRILMVDPSSMPVAAGNATLTIGPLLRTGGVYSGNYKINVSPYFFKNEKGRLAIIVSDESLTGIAQGKAAAVIGTATTSGHGGASRPIEGTATPADINRGTLKLWFMAGERKMIFEPSYHFAEERTAAVVAKPPETSRTANLQPRRPASYRDALDTTDNHP